MSIAKVVVQERRRLFRDGLALVLDAQAELEVVGTAGSLAELQLIAGGGAVDVAVVELDLEPAPERIVARLGTRSGLALVGLGRDVTERAARTAVRSGFAAVVDRERGAAAITRAVRSVGLGKVIDLTAAPEQLCRPDLFQLLSARELEVLLCVGQGNTSRETSELLGISRKTVENHKQRTFQKLGVQNQAHAVSVAIRRGLLPPSALAARG